MSYTASGRRPLDCDFGFDFTSRGYGWIDCKLSRSQGAFRETVILCCSEVFDPFPAFILWLEALARSADEAVWTVNQEGCLARLRAVRHGTTVSLHCEEKPGEHRATEWQPRLLLETEPARLVSSAYWSFRNFAESPATRADHWYLTTRADHWEHRMGWEGTCIPEQLARSVANWRRDEFLVALFHAYPSFSDRPEIPSLAPDWDALPESARETVALALLNEKIGGFHGRAPRELKSPAVESWLAASEKRNRR